MQVIWRWLYSCTVLGSLPPSHCTTPVPTASSLNFLGELFTLVCLEVTISKAGLNFPCCTLQFTKATNFPSSLNFSNDGRNFSSNEISCATFRPSVTSN